MQRAKLAVRIALVLPLALLAAASAQPPFKLPKPPGIPGVKVPIPDLVDKLIKKEAPLTTDIADSFPPVPFLDDFDPETSMPLGELPLGRDETFPRIPGLYDFPAQSYCLKAGTFPPNLDRKEFKGAGYLYAPFKGPKAAIIGRILQATVHHPEVKQHETQVLLWAIIAQTKLSDCPKEIINTAKKLLDKKDLQALDGDVLGVLPPEVKKQAMEKMPDDLRAVFEAEDRMRETLTKKASQYTGTVNRVNGRLAQPGEEVSALYAEMESLAVRSGVAPEIPAKDRIPEGRWSYHSDGYFIRLLPRGYSFTHRWVYNPEKFEITRDASGKITALKDSQGAELKISYSGSNPTSATLAQFDTKTGKVADKSVAASGSAGDNEKRSAESVAGVFAGMRTAGGVLTPDKQKDLNDLARLRGAVSADPNASQLVTRAWMSSLARLVSGDKVIAFGVPEPEPRTVAGLRPVALRKTAWQFSGGGFGGGGGGGAGMGAPGRQRLGQSNNKSHDSTNAARNGVKAINKMGKAARVQGGPLSLATWLANWQLDMGDKIGSALEGDPPRPDFTTYAQPKRIAMPPIAWPADISPARRAAIEDFLNALQAVNADFQAGVDSMDKLGGAKQAGDDKWAYGQAAAVVHFKSSSGHNMYILADKAEALAAVLEKENIGKATIGPNDIDAFKKTLQNPPKETFAYGKTLGLSDADMNTRLKEFRDADYAEVRGKSLVGLLREFAGEMRAFGGHFGSLPMQPQIAQQ